MKHYATRNYTVYTLDEIGDDQERNNIVDAIIKENMPPSFRQIIENKAKRWYIKTGIQIYDATYDPSRTSDGEMLTFKSEPIDIELMIGLAQENTDHDIVKLADEIECSPYYDEVVRKAKTKFYVGTNQYNYTLADYDDKALEKHSPECYELAYIICDLINTLCDLVQSSITNKLETEKYATAIDDIQDSYLFTEDGKPCLMRFDKLKEKAKTQALKPYRYAVIGWELEPFDDDISAMCERWETVAGFPIEHHSITYSIQDYDVTFTALGFTGIDIRQAMLYYSTRHWDNRIDLESIVTNPRYAYICDNVCIAVHDSRECTPTHDYAFYDEKDSPIIKQICKAASQRARFIADDFKAYITHINTTDEGLKKISAWFTKNDIWFFEDGAQCKSIR